MAKIPQSILDLCPPIPDLPMIGEGKVRQSYALPGHPDKLLVKATKRVSAYDFVLPALIDFKDECLTAVNFYWSMFLANMFETDVIACGAAIDLYLPEALQGNPELQKVATVVWKYQSPDVEDVFRFLSLGSVAGKTVKCGHRLPPGLKDGDPFPMGGIYTPTNKAKDDHDADMDVNEVVALLGFEHERIVLQIANAMRIRMAERGLILGDGKLEMYKNIIIDEKGTSDSCRVFLASAYVAARKKGKLCSPLDKEHVRNWCRSVGISPKELSPKNPEHVAIAHSKVMPGDVRQMTTLIYRFYVWKLFGMKLEWYQREAMGIEVMGRKPTVEILLGSESDRPQIEGGIQRVSGLCRNRDIVVSCHRNHGELETYLKGKELPDVFIAGAGEAAALPGITKSILCEAGQAHIPVIGVAFRGKNWKADMAARLSIENLPGQPVEMDQDGNAYFGPEGFVAACESAVNDEFLPKTIEKKEMKFGAWRTM